MFCKLCLSEGLLSGRFRSPHRSRCPHRSLFGLQKRLENKLLGYAHLFFAGTYRNCALTKCGFVAGNLAE